MTTRFGWCFSTSEEARIDHDSCPYELGADGAILRCGCACHESGGKSLGMGGLGVAGRYSGSTNQQCPEPARTDPGRRPHPAKEL